MKLWFRQDESLIDAVRQDAQPLIGAANDHDELLALIGHAHLVLLGEASHGTEDFHAERVRITQRLIQEKDFDAVVIDGDWGDAWRVNRHVRGSDDDETAAQALAGFKRFPSWMWRNTVVAEFVAWQRRCNLSRPVEARSGFYGLDLYGATSDSVPVDGGDVEESFNAAQNAHRVKNTEQYLRSMAQADVSSWNLRATHLMETLESLRHHLHHRNGRPPKIVVWAHNTQLGDAAATQMAERGELSLGQLVRTEHGHDMFSVGFTTHAGSVTAASDWDGPAERKRLRPSLPGSHEAILHEVGIDRFMLPLRTQRQREAWKEQLLERSIGVTYRPATDRESHYSFAQITEQFDALIHIDETRALVPLDRNVEWRLGEPPDSGV